MINNKINYLIKLAMFPFCKNLLFKKKLKNKI